MFGFIVGVTSGIIVSYFWNYPKNESKEYDFLLNDMQLSDKYIPLQNDSCVSSYNKYDMTPNFDNSDELVFYYMDCCGFSTNMKPEWNKFEEHAKTLFPTIKITKIAGPNELCRERNIVGYPSVVLYKRDSQPVLFSGERTVEGLTKFVQDNSMW